MGIRRCEVLRDPLCDVHAVDIHEITDEGLD